MRLLCRKMCDTSIVNVAKKRFQIVTCDGGSAAHGAQEPECTQMYT